MFHSPKLLSIRPFSHPFEFGFCLAAFCTFVIASLKRLPSTQPSHAVKKKTDVDAYNYPLVDAYNYPEGRRPEGEGANINRLLVPYHAKCKRIQSRIEFIYIYIYIFICINGLLMRGIGKFGPGK